MLLAVRVKLILDESPETTIPGVKVVLYDRDQQSMDDHLGSGITDDHGEIRFVFDSDSYMDEEDQPLWKADSLPDFYVMVYNKNGDVILSTRDEVVENHLPKLITIRIPVDLARKHSLI